MANPTIYTTPFSNTTWTFTSKPECTEVAHTTLPFDLIYAAAKHILPVRDVETQRAFGRFLDEAADLIAKVKQ